MTRYFVTAWCDRSFTAKCEVDAENPEEALAKAREAIQDAPAEECDDGYHWDQWKVDSGSFEGELLHQDELARLRTATPALLKALQSLREDIRMLRDGEWQPDEDSCNASINLADEAIAKAYGRVS